MAPGHALVNAPKGSRGWWRRWLRPPSNASSDGLEQVLEEEELAALRAHQEHFEQTRMAELVAAQKLEAAERRRAEEVARRVAEERARLEREAAVREKVAAGAFARAFLSGVMSSVVDSLWQQGYFYDPREREVRRASDVLWPPCRSRPLRATQRWPLRRSGTSSCRSCKPPCTPRPHAARPLAAPSRSLRPTRSLYATRARRAHALQAPPATRRVPPARCAAVRGALLFSLCCAG